MTLRKVIVVSETASAIARRNPLGVWRICPAEDVASEASSASCYHRIEDVRVLPIVEAEGKFIQVQGQVLATDIVIRADHAALEQAPKRFDVVRVNVAAHVNAVAMPNNFVRIIRDLTVGRVLIGREQCHFVRDRLFDEPIEGCSVCLFDHFTDHVALTTDSANDRNFLAGLTASPMALFIPMAVLVLSADIGFIDFDLPKKLREVAILHRCPNALTHIPSRPVVAASDLAMDLERGNPLLALSHR
jgi:hypothetical protein